jgi:flagellar motor switch protein FliN
MAIDPIYTAVMDKALEIVKDVLRPILNRDVDLSIIEFQDSSLELLKKTFDEEMVVVEAPIGGALDIEQYYFFSKKLAAAITDLMVMGDGTAEFNENESLDGVAEAINQIVGAEATQWAGELKTDFNPGGAQGSLNLPGDLELDHSKLLATVLKISITDWGEAEFCYFVSRDLFDTLKTLIDPNSLFAPGAKVSDEKSAVAAGGGDSPVKRAEFGDLEAGAGFGANGDTPRNLDLLMDISLPVTIELGRTEMLIRDVLELGPGSVIELQKLSGEPVDLYINDKQFALGEVVVIDENFGIRITELLSVEDRIKALK